MRTAILVVVALIACASANRVKELEDFGSLENYPTYSGFITVNQQYGANLFYYFVESQNDPANDPVVLWLQGGPGCSSLFGAFVENGPIHIDANTTLYTNPYSWNANASVLYVDQPAGTGFSYVTNPEGYVTNEQTMALEMWTLLQTFFFELYPQYSTNDFYVFGESYGGKYVPWLSYWILGSNTNGTGKFINLRGIGIGDGWVDPYYQAGSYAPFLYENSLINKLELDAAAGTYDIYKGLIDAGAYKTADDIGNALLDALVVAAGNVDVYDIRYKDGDPTDVLQTAMAKYLNRPAVRSQLNAGNHQWQACADTPYFALSDDMARSSEILFPQLLAAYPILLYSGNKDLICNYIGTDEYAAIIAWPGQSAFNSATNVSWVLEGEASGYYKSAQGLTHLIVYNAGHMVPFDQPANSQTMLYQFINGGFTDSSAKKKNN